MPTDKKLQEMARHVAYEHVQLRRSLQVQVDLMNEYSEMKAQGDEAYKAWRLSLDGINWETRKNALMESILLHYRNLLEFLAPALTRMADDVITARMFRDVPVPTQWKKRINTLLSHISKKRADTTMAERVWNEFPQMLEDMDKAWLGFLRAMAANYPERVAWFQVYDVEEQLEAGEEVQGLD